MCLCIFALKAGICAGSGSGYKVVASTNIMTLVFWLILFYSVLGIMKKNNYCIFSMCTLLFV